MTPCSVVDIKRTVDMSPLKRIRLRSHAASELKAKGSMRARERRAHVGIAQISGSKKSIFVLSLVLPLEGPPKPSFRWARCLTTGSVYFFFHCNNQLLLHFSIIGVGNYGLISRPNESFVGGSSCVVRSFDEEFGSLVRYHRYSTQGTAGEAECNTRRVSPENLARPISQACTGIAVQPAVKVLGPSRAPRTMLKQCRAAQNLPRADSRASHAKNKNRS